MAEPIDMSKARNAYAKERDRFRRDLLFDLRSYDGLPLTFDIKQNMRFKAASLKSECLAEYRSITRNIGNNQTPSLGSNLRLRSMLSSDGDRRGIGGSSRRSPIHDIDYDDDDISYSAMKSRTTNWRSTEPSVPISKLTYNSHHSTNTNTHVLSFERQLTDEIDRMISSIDQLSESNRDSWLKIPKSDTSLHFFSRYDDTGYSLNSFANNSPLTSSSSSTIGGSNKLGSDSSDLSRYYRILTSDSSSSRSHNLGNGSSTSSSNSNNYSSSSSTLRSKYFNDFD